MKHSMWLCAGSTLITLVLLPIVSAWGADDLTRAPVPAAAEVEAAEKLVRDIFAAEYGAARSDADKAALAKRILSAGMESTDRPAEQYVLFRVARDIAASARDTETALNAVQQLTDGDTVDPAEVKPHGCRLQRR